MAKSVFNPAECSARVQAALGTGIDTESRTLFLVGEVTDQTSYQFLVALSILDTTPGPITVVMNSVGGDEPSGYAIYDALRQARNHTVVKGFGAVQSIAALIIQAADRRLLSQWCRFMIHNGSVSMGPGVDANQLVAIGREVERNNFNYQKILAERAGKPLEEVAHLCGQEAYFSAREAIRYGFADGLIPRRRKR